MQYSWETPVIWDKPASYVDSSRVLLTCLLESGTHLQHLTTLPPQGRRNRPGMPTRQTPDSEFLALALF